jgi:hypothetical protein
LLRKSSSTHSAGVVTRFSCQTGRWRRGSTDFSGFYAAVLCSLGALLYLVPWVVAWRRHVYAQAGIIVLNLLLGWTVLGWLGALIWALSAETEESS